MALAQRWTAAVSMGLVLGALLACKKKPEPAPEPSAAASASAAPAASAVPSAAASASAAAPAATVEAKLGDVKRYGVDKEVKLDDSGVRVTADTLKVYDQADTTTDDVAVLPKGALVFRQVKMGDFSLVEFPSGVGQFSQGWVETKGLSTTVEKVTRAAALGENKTATVTTKDGGAPAPKPDAGAAKPDAGAAKPKPEPPPVPDKKKAAADKAAADKKAADKKAAEKAK
jgi:hypothetical protein